MRSHADFGLQPERTSLAWGRTMMALVVSSIFFVRWLPGHGWAALIPVILAMLAALGIYAGQRVRYLRSVDGIREGRFTADAVAVFWTSGAVIALGAVGIGTVLFVPLQ